MPWKLRSGSPRAPQASVRCRHSGVARLRGVGGTARLINRAIGWVLVLGLAAVLAAPDGLAQDKSPAAKPTSPPTGQQPVEPDAWAAWTCRSADNAAAIDAAIVAYEHERDYSGYVSHSAAAIQRAKLERLKALKPCPPTTGAGALPPTPGGFGPLPPCGDVSKEINKLTEENQKLSRQKSGLQATLAKDTIKYNSALRDFGADDGRTQSARKAMDADQKQLDANDAKIKANNDRITALYGVPPCGEGKTVTTPVPGTPPPPPPVKPPTIPPSVAPEHSMAPLPGGTGLYVGFNLGGASGSSQWIEPDPSTNVFGVSGGLAGGTVGFAVQNGPLLFGVEADMAGGSISGSTLVNCFTPCRTSNSWLATVRGRAGYSLGPVTPFVTGGLAVGDVNAHVGGFPGAGTTQAGWTAGAGLQLPLSMLASGLPEGVTGKIEWLHVDLGSPQVCSPATCGGVANVTYRAELFRLGINIPLSALIAR